ncbi:allophanate hydrolase [Aliagarivorans marinus]|uniref:allophanate hydrolase n=1 Tax=Aliagarivorans marinus TaxID=561965 RepID=UPI0003FAF8A9|nr:allophanate hydrolase [Aliagarivorans marinus]
MEFTSIKALLAAYQSGELQVADYLRQQWRAAHNDQNNCWISLIGESRLEAFIFDLSHYSPADKPLYGVPFAIKDNIDLAGLPTTAGCPDYAYEPSDSAFVVAKLIEAGAVPLGKTNLDQFATGLVGVRSPYGACKNSIDPNYVSGGSSSGSAVSVALKQVLFSLGTDTAGSGRVPAAFNRLVGMKASKGLLSCSGVVPACRSLDCVTLFAHGVEDIQTLLPIAGQYDEADSYAREKLPAPISAAGGSGKLRVGVPKKAQLAFFGNSVFAERFEKAKQDFAALGAELVEVDFQDFLDAARLLYQGPWVAERYAAIQEFFEADASRCLPVIQTIVGGATEHSAVDAFKASYQLQALKKRCDKQLSELDLMLTPTAGNIYTIAELEANPIELNSNLGYYTNFMNLLDYAAVAIPDSSSDGGMPFGITLFAAAGSDDKLLQIARCFESQQPLSAEEQGMMTVAVCGAHLEGLALNHQLLERGASLLEKCQSAAAYKFYALAGDGPARPGMVRVEEGGQSIAMELWQLPQARVGDFLAGIPAPLGLGKVELADGRWVTGFICEAIGALGATDISEFGGWRAYLASLN